VIKRFTSGVAFAICVFIVSHAIVYLLSLDAITSRLAASILHIPAERLFPIGWLLSGLLGFIALALWLIFDPGDWLSNIRTPRPELGSLVIAQDPTFKIEVHRSSGKNNAELFVDLANKNDRLVGFRFELRATVNGKDLNAPLKSSGYVPANGKARLHVRIDDVPLPQDLLAHMEYDVTYYFGNNSRKTRRTAKGITWRSLVPKGQPGPSGGSVVKVITVSYYNEVEQ
jgi:hypothetical protein